MGDSVYRSMDLEKIFLRDGIHRPATSGVTYEKLIPVSRNGPELLGGLYMYHLSI